MKFYKRIVYCVLFVCVFCLLPGLLFAGPEDPCTDPADPCPIDSNLIVLFAAAFVVAAKKAYDYKKTFSVK